MTIKVCILTSVHSPFDTRIFYKEAKSLIRAGYDVTLVAQKDKEEVVDRVKIINLPKPKNRIERMTKTTLDVYLKAIKVDADIYHFHDPELIPIGLLLKLHGKCVIYDVHEDVPMQNLSKRYIPAVFRKPISIIIGTLETFSARCFDGVITATPFINDRFLQMGAYAINVNNYPIISELYLADSRWEDKEKAVCYIGGITEIRGASEMVKAIGKTRYRLILAGDFEIGLIDRLKWITGWQQVQVLGYIDRDGVRTVISSARGGLVVLHPSVNYLDALPVKMFEYMAAGIPVIASNFPLWRKIVEVNKCGICVDPLNPEDIAEAINWIIEHPSEARGMGKNGRRAVEEMYNWGIEEKKLLQLYDVITRQVLDA